MEWAQRHGDPAGVLSSGLDHVRSVWSIPQFISIWGSKLVRIVRSTGRFLRRWIPPNCWLLEFGPCCCNSTQVILSHSFSICFHGSLILSHHRRKGQTTKVSKPCISKNNVRVTISKFTMMGGVCGVNHQNMDLGKL